MFGLDVKRGIFLFILFLCSILLSFFSCGGGGGDNGGNGGSGTTHPPISEMTFQETYDVDIEDRRETFLSTLGTPDTFRIEVAEIEGRTVVSEEWSYVTLGVRLELSNPDHDLPAGTKCWVTFPID